MKHNIRIAVLALQGAFLEHRQMLERLGCRTVEIRQLSDWQAFMANDDHESAEESACRGIVIPGGESTTQLRLLRDLQLFDPIRQAILAGMPVFGTCAGLIMLDGQHLATMDIQVRRNAYGRQLGSFHTVTQMQPLGQIPMTFIRAPYIESVGDGVEVLSVVDGHIVAARQGNQLVTAFHPELDESTLVHEYFLTFF